MDDSQVITPTRRYHAGMTRKWIVNFYKRPEFSRDLPALVARDVIRWWEGRRLFYNLAVGSTGLITCLLLVICAAISESMVGEPIGMPDGPLLGVFAIFFYATVANMCYTAGWITELLVRAAGKADAAEKVALKAFRLGVTFSVLLTLGPAVFCWAAFAVALLTGQKHGPLVE